MPTKTTSAPFCGLVLTVDANKLDVQAVYDAQDWGGWASPLTWVAPCSVLQKRDAPHPDNSHGSLATAATGARLSVDGTRRSYRARMGIPEALSQPTLSARR